MPILIVKDLVIGLSTKRISLVDKVSFSLEKGEILGILGESGCGKSLTGLALLKIFPPGITYYSGEVIINGTNIYTLSEKEVNKIRGKKISIIFQDPLSSLNPVLTIGEQISEVLKYHFNLNKKEIKKKTYSLLEEVGIPDPELRAKSYPHELSGGLRQRAMIAMALAGSPDILIADEPTTALDLTLQIQILDLLKRLNKEKGLSIIFITHDLGILRWFAHRIAVFYAGEIIEIAPTEELFNKPIHPYTKLLFASYPREDRIVSYLKGTPINLLEKPEGCRFWNRCNIACKEGEKLHPELIPFTSSHYIRCFKYGN
ncbi:ABC transporter ATP-binding protein [Candidatus Pacearchaeota archaeon]|nr:MAG: ABC transporter ATP-binding protein [Candidatus Pacearchaeota archaeon]